MSASVLVRPVRLADAGAMTRLQNHIIALGGTTAYEEPRDEAQVIASYIRSDAGVCCHIAEADGQLIGFQSVGLNPKLPPGWAEIGTFVAADVQARGTGQALFAATRAAAQAAGIRVLNATIRADNRPGLGYYAKIGFVDYDSDPAWALANGQVVGRVHRRLDL
ncbi:GNAT family N-acetyltransferase [Xinfangfangia sp. D13-10-4-6]|uniref:GNAT family N-acetyltransferase n=1 Tax=Pseudogemmobacter hezensis TaxID=2737662 RepID=UPI00155275C5|nr:GNAT family N-acetyltransferase [Pseudogemmobacter hezensis]NPD14054.1 GNAT family N-acetyltransferase [Pseudogemmobacter hezensis]